MNNVRMRVGEVIDQKISDAVKIHEEFVKSLEDKLEADKKEHEDFIVNSIVGKFF